MSGPENTPTSIEQINSIQITEENKADKLIEAMDLAKKDGKIDVKEIEALMDKFKNEIDDLKLLLKKNENHITLDARLAKNDLMKELNIRTSGGRGSLNNFGVDSNSGLPKINNSEALQNKFDLSSVSVVTDESLEGKKGLVNALSLNVRNEKGEIIGKLEKGSSIELTGKLKESNGVTFVEIGNNKFVSKNYLNLIESKTSPTSSPEPNSSPEPTNGPEPTSSPQINNGPDVKPTSSPEVKKIDLSKGVNISGKDSYDLFVINSGVKNLPNWNDLPKEVITDNSSKILTMSLESGNKVNIYFGDKKNNQTGEEYVMKYGEIVNGKFEKSGIIGSNFSWDSLDKNNSSSESLSNPWSEGSEQAKAWDELTPEQKKWIGGADPTDKFILARMKSATKK